MEVQRTVIFLNLCSILHINYRNKKWNYELGKYIFKTGVTSQKKNI